MGIGYTIALYFESMPQHIAILKHNYLKLVLAGIKTVESRLTYNAIAPWQQIKPDERIFFKQSGGPFRATAVVEHVDFFDHLTPAKLRKLYDRFNDAVCGSKDYWFVTKATARHATFVTLRDVLPTSIGPAMKPSQGLAWFVIEPVNIPLPFTVTLTDGAIKNGYISLSQPLKQHPQQCLTDQLLTLHLPDKQIIQTDLTDKKTLRWRGWKQLYQTFNMHPDDRVLFEPLDNLTYRVSFEPTRSKIKP